MNGWWLGIASLAACGTKVPVDSSWTGTGAPSGSTSGGTVGTTVVSGTPGGSTTDSSYVGTSAGPQLACGPLYCYSYEYCSVVVPGQPPTGTGTTDPNLYTCVLAPPECGSVSTCACIGCGDLTGTGTAGPYLCEEVPSIGATCTMYAP